MTIDYTRRKPKAPVTEQDESPSEANTSGRIDYRRRTPAAASPAQHGQEPSGTAPSSTASNPSARAGSTSGIDYRRSRFAGTTGSAEASHPHWLSEPLAPVLRDVDGIPTFWVPGTGLTTATVTFRVGRADEQLTRAGVSHLIEHLSLFKLGHQPHYFNGGVEAYFTSFTVRGTPSEVVSFFAGLSSALVNMPMARISDEKNIIATEAEGRGSSAFQMINEIRYGTVGIGALNYREFGLVTLDAPYLDEWRRRYFHRNNAAISISGPYPKALTFVLPPGMPMPAQPEVAVARQLPAQAPGPDNMVIFGLTSPQVDLLPIAAFTGNERGIRRLRYEQALSYTVAFGTAPEGFQGGQLFVMADVLPGKAHLVVGAVKDLIDDLAAHPPTGKEMGQYRERVAAEYFDQDSANSLALNAARHELLGKTLPTWPEAEALLRSVIPSSVAEAVRAGLETAVLLSPEHVGRDTASFHDAGDLQARPVAGTNLKLSKEWNKEFPATSIVLAKHGISVSQSDATTTVLFDQCTAALQWLDGTLMLIGAAGQRVRIPAGMVDDKDYDRLSAVLETSIAADKRVQIEN